MNQGHRRTLGRGLLAGVALTLGAPAFAGLGADRASVATDSAQLHATVQAVPLQSYDIHEITTDTGIAVREYVSRAGTVFAVSWSGPVLPDLRTLLAAHFARYAEALSQPHVGLRKSLAIATPELVLQSGGHLRAYRGWAYLPAMLPPGTSPAQFR